MIYRKRLWIADDHVLVVSSNLLDENYRRLYFLDIESIVISEIENDARFYGGVLAVIAWVLTLGLVLTSHPVLAVLCGLMAAGLSIFSWTRPAARLLLKTRVSRELLPLRTLERARFLLTSLKPEVERAQGVLARETIEKITPLGAAAEPPSLNNYRGVMHYAAFASMLAVALLTPLRLNVETMPVTNAFAGVEMAMVLITVIAAVRQHRSMLGRTVRTIIALALTWCAASYVVTQTMMFSAIRTVPRNSMRFRYWTDPVKDIAIADAVAFAVFGIAGILALLSQRSTNAD